MALDIDQFLARPQPEDKWIVEQLLPLEGGLLLYGSPKMGKTLLAMGMGIAISDGHPTFLDLNVRMHGRVLYVQVDMSPFLYDSYVRKMLPGHTFKNFYFIDRREIPGRSLNVMKPKDADWLKAEVDKTQPMVVFLDTLRTLHSGEENDNTMMSNTYEKLLGITKGATLVIVHHAKKPGMFSDIINDARGATSVAGKVDVVAQLGGSRKKPLLAYMTRDENLFPDGIPLHQMKNGLFEVKLGPAQLLARFELVNPHPTEKDAIDYLIEQGVPRSSAYKVVKKMKGEEEGDT